LVGCRLSWSFRFAWLWHEAALILSGVSRCVPAIAWRQVQSSDYLFDSLGMYYRANNGCCFGARVVGNEGGNIRDCGKECPGSIEDALLVVVSGRWW